MNEKEANHPAHPMDRTANWRSHGGWFTLAVKVYEATVEALKKKERQGETQFTAKTEVCLHLNGMFFIFLNLTLFMIKLRVLVLFSLLYR
jgi:hypothetical protein